MHLLALALCVPLLALGSPTPSSGYSLPPALGDYKLRLVRQNAIDISNQRSVHAPTQIISHKRRGIVDETTRYSWEIGTLAEALTELEWHDLGVFAPGSIPPPTHLQNGQASDVLSIAERCARLSFF